MLFRLVRDLGIPLACFKRLPQRLRNLVEQRLSARVINAINPFG